MRRITSASKSPLARALLKRELGEEIELETPSGTQHYLISGIEYA